MREDGAAAEILDIASSTLSLLERARHLLESLQRWLPLDDTWLALSDPRSTVYATAGSTHGEADGTNHVPQGVRVPLTEPGGPYLGMLTLLFTSADEPSEELRERVRRLAPLVARGVSPMRSLLATARLVQDAAHGVVLLDDGDVHPLPGLLDHPLLAADSPVVELARESLRAGRVYRSFLWPATDGGEDGHARLTALAATEVPPFVLGTLLLTPHAGCAGLTPRELEVLGLVVEGCSNQQLARRLGVTPRTVAAHVEHLLHQLGAPTRTAAAVLAEREGCYVPSGPSGPWDGGDDRQTLKRNSTTSPSTMT